MSTVTFFTTFKNKAQAATFAELVVRKKLAACVQVLPSLESHYFWKNKLCKDKEVLVIGKTTRSKFIKLKTQIKKIHPYELPELVAIKITDGYAPYLDWLKAVK